MAVASMVFTEGTLSWLSFGEGLGVVALALCGLAAHELSTERVVHELAIEERTGREREPVQYATA